MARMHARKKGRSGSTTSSIKTPQKWIRYKKAEIEKIIIKLAKEGHSSAEIGMILRDQYGIPSSRLITGEKIAKIMKDNKLYPEIPEDLFNLLKKAVNLREHMTKNKKDSTSKRGLELLESKIRRLGKYYVKNKILPETWKYDYEKAKLLVQEK